VIVRRSWGRALHGATVLVIALSLTGQLAVVFSGRGAILDAAGLIAPLPVRLLRFVSDFTIQSNLLAASTALTLMQRPARDGRIWRVVRADAIVGMTVTFVVYIVVLRPIVHLEGVAKLSDIGFHYVAPALTVTGWFVFGPWPRIDRATLIRQLAWPVAYLAYVLVLGAISGWYPYPFITATKLGYARVLLNAVLVTLLLLAVAAVYGVLDARRGGRRAEPL
jgi:hypothetical protein